MDNIFESYKPEFIDKLAKGFTKLSNLFSGNTTTILENVDIYSLIASMMYDVDYSECTEATPEGNKRRNLAKHFVLPLIVDCGGALKETEE